MSLIHPGLFDSVAQPRLRACVGVLCAILAICVLTGPASPAHAEQLEVIPDGNGTVSPAPVPPGGTKCTGAVYLLVSCRYSYDRGEEVTLTAAPNAPGLSFLGWSDERCPGTGACTLSMDADRQSVTALFSPQRVLVTVAGPGSVTTGLGAPCLPISPLFLDCGEFPLFSRVTLVANPASAADPPTWVASLCEAPGPRPGDPVCIVNVYGVTWTSVGFGEDPGGELAPAISVRFRILKLGTGRGTVRGRSLDCGSTCTLDEDFGQRITLHADPAPGSTFVGWRGACAAAPTCSLAIGPVTAVVARFDAEAPSRRPDPPPRPPQTVPSRTPFVVQMRRMVVSGHGRHRRILMRVRVTAPATVRGRLSRGQRRVASWRWRVAAGRPLLRAPVPARARKGVYKLRLTFRSRARQTRHITRHVRLPR